MWLDHNRAKISPTGNKVGVLLLRVTLSSRGAPISYVEQIRFTPISLGQLYTPF